MFASTLLGGTGLGIAFSTWPVHRRRRHARCPDGAGGGDCRLGIHRAGGRRAVATAAWMVQYLGAPYSTFRIGAAVALFFVVGACWLRVLWPQMRARNLARQAAVQRTPLPPAYHRAMRWWFVLGWPAFPGLLAIFWLMVFKPA